VISADHVLASGALPPGFPGIWIDGELYYDGGVSSNTPIEELAEELTADLTRDTIVFLIDLWDRKGAIPQSLDEVLWRQNCIQYGSRKSAAVSVVETYQREAKAQVEEQRVPPKKLEVCQVMFERSRNDWTAQFSFADADFTRSTYEQMAKLGYEDMQRGIEHPYRVPWVASSSGCARSATPIKWSYKDASSRIKTALELNETVTGVRKCSRGSIPGRSARYRREVNALASLCLSGCFSKPQAVV
jgi:NTE family protein